MGGGGSRNQLTGGNFSIMTMDSIRLSGIYPGLIWWGASGGGGHSHMEVTGMCGQDPQSRGLSVTD